MNSYKNIVINYGGQIWAGLAGIISLPYIINCLGPDSFGIVGVFTSLMAWLLVADFGMCSTINREFINSRVDIKSRVTAANLLRSFEFIYGIILLIVGLLLYNISGWISVNWFQSPNIDSLLIETSFKLISVLAPLQCYESLYRGALLGFQRHDIINSIRFIVTTLRWIGTALVLTFLDASIQTFFIWHIFVSLISIILMLVFTYYLLAVKSEFKLFSSQELKKVYKFSSGMFVQSILTLLLTQSDKLILSKLLSLESFGYYMIAFTYASMIVQLITPITSVYFPIFTELINSGNNKKLIHNYHKAVQLATIAVMPIAILIIFNSTELLKLTSLHYDHVKEIDHLFLLLSIGVSLNILTHIPYVLTLACGWTKYAIVTNTFSIIFLFPCIVLGVPIYGAEGAAWILILLNIGYLLFGMFYLHKRVMKNEYLNWLKYDILIPSFFIFIVALLLKLIFNLYFLNLNNYIVLGFTLTSLYFVAIISSNKISIIVKFYLAKL